MSVKVPPSYMHPTNFRHERAVKRLLKDFGIEGFGIVTYLLETLAETEKHMYPLNDVDMLADEMKTSVPKVQVVISQYGLFQVIEDEGEKFISAQLNEWLIPFYKKREEQREKALIGVAKRKATYEKQLKELSLFDSSEPRLNQGSTTAQQVSKERKKVSKKRKEEKKEPLNFDDFLGKDFSVLIEDSIHSGVITCISESLSVSGKYNISYTTEKGTDTILPCPLTQEEMRKYVNIIRGVNDGTNM